MNTNQLKMRTYLGLLPALLVLFLSTDASSQTEAVINRLSGSWEGEGKTLGMAARLQMKWEWVLANKFLRLSLRNEMSANGKTQVFEGHAYYQPVGSSAAATYEARWFDSRGLSFPIKAHAEGDTLIALWGTPDTEQGKSVYRLIAQSKIEVVDSVRGKDGTWKEFGRFVLQRN